MHKLTAMAAFAAPVAVTAHSPRPFLRAFSSRSRVLHAARRDARPVQMIGPMPFGSSSFFESPIVQEEASRLERDHNELVKLGARYVSFDRAGKLAYIDELDNVFDRWLIMLKRFQLSEDFQCQLYVQQLKTKLEEYGLTIESLMANTRLSLKKMREDASRS